MRPSAMRFEGNTGGLTTDRVEARRTTAVSGVSSITRLTPETCSKVRMLRPLATDDTALEVIRGNVHGGNGDLGCVVGAAQRWNRRGQNLLGGLVALGANLLLGLANGRRPW